MKKTTVCCFASGGPIYLSMGMACLDSLYRISKDQYRLVIVHQNILPQDLAAASRSHPFIEFVELRSDNPYAKVPMFMRKVAIYDLLEGTYHKLFIIDSDSLFHADAMPQIEAALEQQPILLFGKIYPDGTLWNGENFQQAASQAGYEVPNFQINGGFVAIKNGDQSEKFINWYRNFVQDHCLAPHFEGRWMKTNDEPYVALASFLSYRDSGFSSEVIEWKLTNDLYLTCVGATRANYSLDRPAVIRKSVSDEKISPKILHYVNSFYWPSYLRAMFRVCVAASFYGQYRNQLTTSQKLRHLKMLGKFLRYASWIWARNVKARIQKYKFN